MNDALQDLLDSFAYKNQNFTLRNQNNMEKFSELLDFLLTLQRENVNTFIKVFRSRLPLNIYDHILYLKDVTKKKHDSLIYKNCIDKCKLIVTYDTIIQENKNELYLLTVHNNKKLK
jgi:hypothetical protein